MSPLSDQQFFTLETAGAIIAGHCQVLSDFELETLAEVGRLLRDHGRNAPITDRQWAVIEPAVDAMLATANRLPTLRRCA